MMELAHSLLLNEEALQKIPENKKPVFVFEWLRFLDKVLSAAQKVKYFKILHVSNTERKILFLKDFCLDFPTMIIELIG